MSVYLVARSLHIGAMFLTLILIIATEPLFVSAARAQNITQLAQRYRLAQRLQQFSQLTTLVGLVAGVVLVVLAGWNPLAPWLLATYSLLVVMSIIGRIGMVSWQRQVHTAFQLGEGHIMLADVRALLGDRRALAARVAVIAIFITIILVMREKPSFGW